MNTTIAIIYSYSSFCIVCHCGKALYVGKLKKCSLLEWKYYTVAYCTCLHLTAMVQYNEVACT